MGCKYMIPFGFLKIAELITLMASMICTVEAYQNDTVLFTDTTTKPVLHILLCIGTLMFVLSNCCINVCDLCCRPMLLRGQSFSYFIGKKVGKR